MLEQLITSVIQEIGTQNVVRLTTTGVVVVSVVGYGVYTFLKSGSDSTPPEDLLKEEHLPSLDDLDEDEYKKSVKMLEDQSLDETDPKNIREQAALYKKASSAEDQDINIAAVQNDDEESKADKKVLAPDSIKERPDHQIRNGDYVQYLTVTGYPSKITEGWLTNIVGMNKNVRMGMYIHPRDTKDTKDKLESNLTKYRANLARKYKKNKTNTHKEEKMAKRIDALLDKIIDGETQLNDFGIYFEIVGETEKEMRNISKNIQNKLGEKNIETTPVPYGQIQAQDAVVPVCKKPFENNELMQERAVSASFPFIEPSIMNPEGMLQGFDFFNKPIIESQWNQAGYDCVAVGKKGSGKTFYTLLKDFRMRFMNPGMESIFLDPMGDDYVPYVEDLDGQVVKFGGDYKINPLEIRQKIEMKEDDPYKSKLRRVQEMFKTHFHSNSHNSEITSRQSGLLTRVIRLAYLRYGITTNPKTHNNKSPIIDDIIDILHGIEDGEPISDIVEVPSESEPGIKYVDKKEVKTQIKEAEKKTNEKHENPANILVTGLEDFLQTGINSNLNGRTNIELNKDIIAFDMSSFADTGEAPLILHVMLDWLYQRAGGSRRKTQITLDEVHYLLNQKHSRDLLELFIRHSRHWNAGLTLVTQTANEFTHHEQKQYIYDQCDIKATFHHESLEEEVVDQLDMTADEAKYVRKAKTGENNDYSEMLLNIGDYPNKKTRVAAQPYEQHMVDSDKDIHQYVKQNILGGRGEDSLDGLASS